MQLNVRSLCRLFGAACFATVLTSVSASAQSLEVITVPWRGDPTLRHPVANGAAITLQGVAVLPPGCSITSATWDPGDGSAPIPVAAVGNARVLEASHVYNGSNNQPFIATLTVNDSCGNTAFDTFRVVVQSPSLDVEVDQAIDEGLWALHKRMVLSSVGPIPTGYWAQQSRTAATASALQAMEIHGHRESGNGGEDPYVDDVARGLAHLLTDLQEIPIALQPAGDPDTNGNGIGLRAPYTGSEVYVGGQVIDALVASGTPNAVAVTGPAPGVLGRTYAEIVQDMLDAYYWGQTDTGVQRGGWRYNFNSDADNSACQWMAIGGIAAERNFGAVVPQFVRDENNGFWLPYSQFRDGTFASWDGSFGYGGPISFVDVSGMNTTPSGIVQLIFDGIPTSDMRFDAAQAFMARNWTQLTLNNRVYGMFAAAKSFRLALPAPLQTLHSGTTSFDWYRAEVAQGAPVDGVARRLVDIQQGDGSWDGYWVVDDIATAWAVITLSSTIVDLGPVAVCKANPENTAATFPITFSGAFSYHTDPLKQIVNYEWDFESDGTYDATGIQVVHSYPATGDYDVTLRVTDNSTPVGLQSTGSCTVHITPPPFPPDSNPGGPYYFCQGYQPWILDGTASTDPDGSIVLYEWDFDPQPLDLDFNDAFGPTADVTAYFQTLPPGTYDAALRVTDNNTLTNVDFTTIHVVPPGAPCPGQQPLLNCPPDFTEIWAGGIPAGQADPMHTGTATYVDNCSTGVQLGYNDVSVVPNTPQNPGAPEVVITRRWTLTDGCGGNVTCDQTITLLSPSGQMGGLTLDLQPNLCPNEIAPDTKIVRVTIPGTWTHGAGAIVPSSLTLHRADRVGRVLKYGSYLFGPNYADVTGPYYGQNGPCDARNPDGRADATLFASGRALRALLKLGGMPDGSLVNIVVRGRLTNGESFALTDWLTVRN